MRLRNRGRRLWPPRRKLHTTIILCCGLLLTAQAVATDLMLPQVYTEHADVSGWLMSEKLDGVRGYWNGQQMLSKNGNIFSAPEDFIRNLPPFALDGELWGGRGRFEQTVAVVKQQHPHDGWLQIKFAIFDVPQAPGAFTQRITKAVDWFADHPSAYAFIIPQIPVSDHDALQSELLHIEDLGGEGLIVRNPDALYATGRSPEILKVKNNQDAEATVLAHLPGKGRNKGRLGAVVVEIENGKQFKIGSGFSDAERETPPPVGTIITFRHYGTYQSGIPKFPSFLRIRLDQGL